jgi:hypothetical protein
LAEGEQKQAQPSWIQNIKLLDRHLLVKAGMHHLPTIPKVSRMDNESFVLYKYRAINKWLIESLINQTLYFATPDKLNDPFDCRIDLQKAIERAVISATGDRRDSLSSFLTNPEFFKNWRATFDKMGVCSFSKKTVEETLMETLMWAHYADDHRGVRLKYQFRAASLMGDMATAQEIVTSQDVEYLDDSLVPWLVGNAPMDMTEFAKELAKRYLRTKSPAWAYEQEARIIRQKSGPFKLKDVFLAEVCFGLRTAQDDRDLVIKLAQSYCHDVKFSQMERGETEFRFAKKAT